MLTPHQKVMNVAPYIVAGLNPEIHLLVKNNTSPIDYRYYNSETNAPFDMEDDTKVKHTNALLPFTIKIDDVEHPFSFNNVFTCHTEGGTPLLIAVDICLDHDFGTAKKNITKLIEADTFNMPLFISHILISNTIHLNPSHSCGKNVMHVDSYYSLIKCKEEGEQHILEDTYSSSFGNGYKIICVDSCPCGSLLDVCSLAAESQAGHLHIVNALLRAGACVDRLDSNGLTPLYLALFYGHNAITKSLINAGANLNFSLLIATWKGAIHVVRKLIDAEANVSVADFQGFTPLYLAFYYGHNSIAQILINAGANLEQTLIFASWEGSDYVVRNLINEGANASAEDFEGFTPLYLALFYGHNSIAQTLIQAGANLNQSLLVASRMGCIHVVRHLINAGANASIADFEGFTPLYLALFYGHNSIAQTLIQAGASLNQSFLVAARMGDIHVVYNLIALGAALNQSDARVLQAKPYTAVQPDLPSFRYYLYTTSPHSLAPCLKLSRERYNGFMLIYYAALTKHRDIVLILLKACAYSDPIFLDKFMDDIKRNAQKEKFIPYNPTFLAPKKPIFSEKDAIGNTEKEEIKQIETSFRSLT